MVYELVDGRTSLEQIADELRSSQVVVHRVITLLAQTLDHLFRFCITLTSRLYALQVADSLQQLLQALLCGQQRIVREVYRSAIMRRQDKEAYRHRRISLLQQRVVACEELLQRDEVVIRLTHLLAVDGQHVVVHPVFHGLMSHRGLRLCNLTLMVREYQV